ncbi:hypothetical protein C0Q70_20058 [Pomacea canaliculata]|uniref:Uncharacterized protein n=1 Tax=Pomacea canaliculata TaxID=400727 RepID=A0A2T7NEF7_POMCA|nr:hypothetical protein C0Q70_20058 [Pomacea canaliculata]
MFVGVTTEARHGLHFLADFENKATPKVPSRAKRLLSFGLRWQQIPQPKGMVLTSTVDTGLCTSDLESVCLALSG